MKKKITASEIMEKYPGRYPVIVSKLKGCRLNDLEKKKFLIPEIFSVGQLMVIIKKHIKLLPQESFFLFTKNNTLAPTSTSISSLYNDHKDKDGFLYLIYTECNTFGTYQI